MVVRHSGMPGAGAVLAGIAVLIFSFALDPTPRGTATAAPTPGTVSFTVREGTNISISRSDDGQTIIMDLHGFLYRIPGQGGPAVRPGGHAHCLNEGAAVSSRA